MLGLIIKFQHEIYIIVLQLFYAMGYGFIPPTTPILSKDYISVGYVEFYKVCNYLTSYSRETPLMCLTCLDWDSWRAFVIQLQYLKSNLEGRIGLTGL